MEDAEDTARRQGVDGAVAVAVEGSGLEEREIGAGVLVVGGGVGGVQRCCSGK